MFIANAGVCANRLGMLLVVFLSSVCTVVASALLYSSALIPVEAGVCKTLLLRGHISEPGVHEGMLAHRDRLYIDANLLQHGAKIEFGTNYSDASCQRTRLGHNFVSCSCSNRPSPGLVNKSHDTVRKQACEQKDVNVDCCAHFSLALGQLPSAVESPECCTYAPLQ